MFVKTAMVKITKSRNNTYFHYFKRSIMYMLVTANDKIHKQNNNMLDVEQNVIGKVIEN